MKNQEVNPPRLTCEAAALPDRRVETTCCMSGEKCWGSGGKREWVRGREVKIKKSKCKNTNKSKCENKNKDKKESKHKS